MLTWQILVTWRWRGADVAHAWLTGRWLGSDVALWRGADWVVFSGEFFRRGSSSPAMFPARSSSPAMFPARSSSPANFPADWFSRQTYRWVFRRGWPNFDRLFGVLPDVKKFRKNYFWNPCNEAVLEMCLEINLKTKNFMTRKRKI